MRLNLMVAILWLGVMIADFHWSRLLVSLICVAVYALVLIWFEENNESQMFYLVGYAASFFALYFVYLWIDRIPPQPEPWQQQIQRNASAPSAPNQ